MRRICKPILAGALPALVISGATAAAQEDVPTRLWVQYLDPVSGTVCGLVHGANAEFVVLPQSGAMVKVTGTDLVMPDLVVDEVGNVYYRGESKGLIEFAVDADGDRAVFWSTLTGQLVSIGDFDVDPQPSDIAPSDVRNTGCDACPKWDNPAACIEPGSDSDVDSNANENGGDSPTADATSGLTGMCGSGAAAAATLTLAFLLAGRGARSVVRPRRGR
jgi:hypothetical protein